MLEKQDTYMGEKQSPLQYGSQGYNLPLHKIVQLIVLVKHLVLSHKNNDKAKSSVVT